MAPVLSHGELSDDYRLRSRRAPTACRDLLSDPLIHLRLDPPDGACAQPVRRGADDVNHGEESYKLTRTDHVTRYMIVSQCFKSTSVAWCITLDMQN